MIKLGRIKTSRIELIDITKAWLALSLAFVFFISRKNLYNKALSLSWLFSLDFLILFAVALFTLGLGFLLHESAHKFVAQRYGCVAEFRAHNQMLYIAVGLAAFLGAIIAAPGAVMISGMITRRENGLISLAGPLTNYILAVVFLLLHFSFPIQILSISPWLIGFQINIILGAFNMLPFWVLDGKKIFNWNIPIWAVFMAIGVIGYIFIGYYFYVLL